MTQKSIWLDFFVELCKAGFSNKDSLVEFPFPESFEVQGNRDDR